MQVNSFQLDQLDQLGHAVGVAKRSVAVMYQPQLWAGGELLGVADWFLGGRLEPTYDAGIDCDGWHLWLPA